MRMKTLHGRLIASLMAVVMMATLFVPALVSAATVSKSFTTHSVASSPLIVFGGETFTFNVSGTFSGSVKLQKSDNGSDYRDLTPAVSTQAAYSGTFYADSALDRPQYYRVYCSTHQSGTIVTSLADVNDSVRTFKNYKGVDVVEIKDDGLTGASLADGAIVTAKLASSAVITAKMYLDLPTWQLACITSKKQLGTCSNVNAATGACNSCQ